MKKSKNKILSRIERIVSRTMADNYIPNSIPIDVHNLAKKLSIKIAPDDFTEDILGCYVSVGNKRVIGVNRNLNKEAQRFVIAHNLGHHLLSHQSDPLFYDKPHFYEILFADSNINEGNIITANEREANIFATILLIPEKQFRDDLKQKPFSLIGEGFKNMAKRFQVSESVTLIKKVCH